MYFSKTHFLEHTDEGFKITMFRTIEEINWGKNPYKEKYLIKGKQIEMKQ